MLGRSLPPRVRRSHSSDAVSEVSRRTRVRRLIAVLGTAVLLAGVLAPAALATSTTNPLSGGVSPISPVSPATSTSTTPTVVNTSTSSQGSSSLSTSSALVVVIVAAVLIIGIAYFIRRDARRHAPVRAGAGGGDVGSQGRRTGSKAPPKQRKLSAAERKRRKRGRAKR